MKHLRKVLERDPLAHEPVAIRRHAFAAEVARIGGTDNQERDRLRAGNELLGHLRKRVPEWRARRGLARGVIALGDDLDVLPPGIADGLAQHLPPFLSL